MHKKQYIALARAIKENRLDNIEHINANNQPETPVIFAVGFLNALCDILAADNKNFDKERFLEACK